MPTPPLTHHDILGLVEPFTRRGRHLDLAASQRAERRLAFKPIEHVVEKLDAATAPLLRETLQLDNPADGLYRLTRTLWRSDGLQATLEAEGPEPGELLARVEEVAHERQFVSGAGYRIAMSFRLDAASSRPVASAPLLPPLMLTHAAARIGEMTLALDVPRMNGILADFVLTQASGDTIELPDDLLAVLGWPWTRLTRSADGWRSSLRLRGRGLARSADAQAKLQRTVAHLARTLAEPPARFHARLLPARWRVVARRAFPLLFTFGLVAGVAAVPKLQLAPDSVLRMLIFHAPPLLMMLVFCMREMPRIEIPPWPKPLPDTSWRHVQASVDLEPAR